MNKLFNPLYALLVLLVIAVLLSACIPPVVNVAQAAPAVVSYQSMLGKSMSDQSVADFIASNNCASSGSLQLCPKAGLALEMDKNQIVQNAFLYAHDSEDFSAYRGELPFGLLPDDTRTDVERKLGQPRVTNAPGAGWEPGLPDQGHSPDHVRYWANYQRFGMTIIYDSPSANDHSATIYAILVNR